jgi:hypothetical protein
MDRFTSRVSVKAIGLAVLLSLLLVACGSDDKKSNDDTAGSNNAIVTPTQAAEESTKASDSNIQEGAVVQDEQSSDTVPTRIPMREVPATPGDASQPVRRGSDGSMSSQALGTPGASPVSATPVASPVSGTPEATPASATPQSN